MVDAPLTYWHSAGDVVAHRFPSPVRLTQAETFDALTLHLRGMGDAAEALDMIALAYHQKRHTDLATAMVEASRWSLCARAA